MSRHYWFRYVFENAFDPGESPQHMALRIRRNLEVRGVRPADGLTYDEAVQRIAQGSGFPVEPFDCPAWALEERPFESNPSPFPALERLFAKLRDEPLIDPDPIMDGTLTDPWSQFMKLGKPALQIYCENFRAAVGVEDSPGERGYLIGSWLDGIDSAASLLIDAGDFKNLARSLRIDPDLMPQEDGIPFGLLRGFALLMDLREQGLDVEDPQRWWKENERVIPTLKGQGKTIRWNLGDL